MARNNRFDDTPLIVSHTPPPSGDDFQEQTRRVNSDVAAADLRRKRLVHVYQAEPKVSVMIAPMYEAYFGRNMHVMLNGVAVSVPCDGKPYTIPDSFAAVVQHRLRLINEQQRKQKRFSDVSNNNEASPGALALY